MWSRAASVVGSAPFAHPRTTRPTTMDATSKTITVLKSAKLDSGELRGWEFSIESESRFLTRDGIDRARGWRISAPVHDHPPAHVHCRKDDAVVVVYLDDFRWVTRTGKPKVNDIRRLIGDMREREEFFRKAYADIQRFA